MFLKSDYRKATGTRAEDVVQWCVEQPEEYYKEYPYEYSIYPDNAEQLFINSIAAKSRFRVYNSLRRPIIDRVRCMQTLLANDRVKFVEGDCDELVKAFSEALWDDKSLVDKRLDNGTFNNDIIDAAEYSFEYNLDRLVNF